MGSSILAGIGQLVQPLFTPLGFGSQLGAYGWVFVVAAVMGLIAKENVIAGFGTMGGGNNGGDGRSVRRGSAMRKASPRRRS